jgi:hypothetical protein
VVWVLPVLAYVRSVVGVDPLTYLKLFLETGGELVW